MPNKKVDNYRVNRDAGPQADRRRKLTPEDRLSIALWHGSGWGIRQLARHFNVSPRTIGFILHPERLARNKELRKQRGGWQQYYNKTEHAKSMQEHREYKKALMKKHDCESFIKSLSDKLKAPAETQQQSTDYRVPNRVSPTVTDWNYPCPDCGKATSWTQETKPDRDRICTCPLNGDPDNATP